MGICNLRAFNSALLMKGFWSFCQARTLPWVRFLELKHYRYRAPVSFTRAPIGCCPLWKGILSTTSAFHASVFFSIGDGTLASFWNSRWNGDFILRYRFPSLHATARGKHLSVRNWVDRFAASTNLGFDATIAGQAQLEVGQLTTLLDNFQFSNGPDVINWRWSSSGGFTVSSAYLFLVFDGVEDRSTRHLWPLKIPLSIKIFVWLAARNRLLTADQLSRRGWAGPSVCTLSMAHAERLDHILFDCPFARTIWIWLLSSFPSSCQRLLQAPGDLIRRWMRARSVLPASVLGSFDFLFTAVCWEIWTERNRRIFDGSSCSSVDCGLRAVNTAQTWANLLRR